MCISLKEKLETFKEQEYKTIFDLKEELNLIDNPSLLIGFDKGNIMYGALPFHSKNKLDILEGSKLWSVSRLNWKIKEMQLLVH